MLSRKRRLQQLGDGGGTAPDFINNLASTLNCRASYGGVPWVSTPSAGVNGGNLVAFGTAPTIGAAVNGFTPAQISSGVPSALKTTNISASFVLANAATMVVYFVATAAPPPGPFFAESQLIITDKGWGLTLSTNGIVARNAGSATVAVACSLNNRHMAAFRYDGAFLKCRVDTTDCVPLAEATGLDTTDDPIGVGARNPFGSFDGRVFEVQVFKGVLSDATLTAMRAAYLAKYP